MHPSQVIIKPLVTEKATARNKDGVYTFHVHQHATKIDVKNAIRMIYGVEAFKVNVLKTHEKFRGAGRKQPIRKRHAVKKAIVALKGKKTIDVFKPKI